MGGRGGEEEGGRGGEEEGGSCGAGGCQGQGWQDVERFNLSLVRIHPRTFQQPFNPAHF